MKKQLLTASLLVLASSIAIPAFALDRGPRFAADRLDKLVAQHAEAARHLASATPAPAAAPDDRAPR
jgi:hypothetical protein